MKDQQGNHKITQQVSDRNCAVAQGEKKKKREINKDVVGNSCCATPYSQYAHVVAAIRETAMIPNVTSLLGASECCGTPERCCRSFDKHVDESTELSEADGDTNWARCEKRGPSTSGGRVWFFLLSRRFVVQSKTQRFVQLC